MGIIVSDLVKRFDGKTILNKISLELAPGEFSCMLGPSGCGKTTALRCIAGLETPEEGRIQIGDTVVFDAKAGINLPSYERNLGMVFQSYAIWPHMSVFENVAFPLRIRKMASAEVEERVGQALGSVGMTAFRERSVQQLSGGQQQRVAVARAMVHSPSAMLFDEPLSNLDARLRDHTRAEIRRLQRELGVVSVYVTHDQSEALSLSDRIIVMEAGNILQVGPPDAVYNRPDAPFVAEVMGPTNFIPKSMLTAESRSLVEKHFEAEGAGARDRAMLLVRPDRIKILATGQEPGHARFRGVVRQRLFLGSYFEYHLDGLAEETGGESLPLRVFSRDAAEENDTVWLGFEPRDSWPLD